VEYVILVAVHVKLVTMPSNVPPAQLELIYIKEIVSPPVHQDIISIMEFVPLVTNMDIVKPVLMLNLVKLVHPPNIYMMDIVIHPAQLVTTDTPNNVTNVTQKVIVPLVQLEMFVKPVIQIPTSTTDIVY